MPAPHGPTVTAAQPTMQPGRPEGTDAIWASANEQPGRASLPTYLASTPLAVLAGFALTSALVVVSIRPRNDPQPQPDLASSSCGLFLFSVSLLLVSLAYGWQAQAASMTPDQALSWFPEARLNRNALEATRKLVWLSRQLAEKKIALARRWWLVALLFVASAIATAVLSYGCTTGHYVAAFAIVPGLIFVGYLFTRTPMLTGAAKETPTEISDAAANLILQEPLKAPGTSPSAGSAEHARTESAISRPALSSARRKGVAMAWEVDPVARYQRLVAARAVSTATSPTSLQAVIDDEQQHPQPNIAGALAVHLANTTSLTLSEAQDVVGKSLPTGGSAATKADAVSKAATTAAGVSGDVELSDPVMLWPWARVVFAVVLTGVVVLSIVLAYLLAIRSGGSTVSAAAYVALAVVGALCLVGVLVLVMGYKNVTIKGGTAAPQ